ncbi:MAG TPA: hypothetical protein PLO67_14780 [Saprospiraceae bacterium]|nr:hypothetical protein [Saprospiraceae bacterium]HPI05593.1 hypothetical protein [Saprospiraceae bacterium]
MKKAIFFFAFIFALGMASANAQSCCAGKTACASKMSKAASSDASIEKRMADDGTVSYVRKEADAQGNVRFVSVQYDETANAFVNVAPKTATASDKADMTKKSCSAATTGKACCAGKTAGKSCAKEQEQ